MNTIKDTINSVALTGDIPALEAALVAREQEMAETLQLVAARFNLMPQVVAKVICMIGMGEPCEGERRAHVDTMYAAMLNEIEEQRQVTNDKYREMGLPFEIPPFEDPLAEGLSAEMSVPDSPEA